MAKIKKESFGKLPDGREASLYTLSNTKGAAVKLSDLGARMVAWRTLARGYEYVNILKGAADVAECLGGAALAGATRIDGKKWETELWTAREEYEGIRFTLPDEKISLLYSFSNDNELLLRYEYDGDGAAAAPITRACFNLNGSGDVKGGNIKIFADEYLPEGEASPVSVAGTARDLREAKPLADVEAAQDVWRVLNVDPEIEMEPGMFGYDPTCPIDYLDAGLKNAVWANAAQNGLELTMFTNLPGVILSKRAGGSDFALEATESAVKAPWRGQTVFALKLR